MTKPEVASPVTQTILALVTEDAFLHFGANEPCKNLLLPLKLKRRTSNLGALHSRSLPNNPFSH